MIVYRLGKAKYSKDLSGAGAERTGGRWNSKGVPLLYTSASRALCVTEIAVHVPLGILPKNYNLTAIEVPDKAAVAEIEILNLPFDWKSFPYPDSTKIPGDNFVTSASHLVLKVPSAVVQGDYNYLINPRHAGFAAVKIVSVEPFEFDERLFKKL
jgi:RES domain-containing protein